jgi:AraC-like DNA-binding protein
MDNQILLPNIIAVGVYDSTANPKLRQTSITPYRKITSFEIELPTEEGGRAYIGEKEYPICPDRVFIAKPGRMRHTLLPYKCRYIHLDANSGLSERLNRLPDVIKLTEIKKTAQIYRDIINISTNDVTDSELLLYSRILELIWHLEDECRKSLTSLPENESIAEALRYIDENIERNITLEELAKKQHLSLVYFHKLFKKTLGKTPYRYILDKKLSIAKNELIMTSKTCLEIALGLGFSSQSYFNYTFRKETGQSPLQFRKEYNSRYPE